LNADAESMYEVGDALDYMGRLVQAAKLDDNSSLAMMRKSSFLNYLVNLGSVYSQYRSLIPGENSGFYLDEIWQSTNFDHYSPVMRNYWQQMGEGNENHVVVQSTFQFLDPLEGKQHESASAQKIYQLANAVRSGFIEYGRFQVIPRGGDDDPTIESGDIGEFGAEYVNYIGDLFIKGSGDNHAISYNDAVQGSVGNCYLIAAMAAIAAYRPDAIQSMIHDNGDGTYDIRFENAFGLIRVGGFFSEQEYTTTIRIDADLPTKTSMSTPRNYTDLVYAKALDESSSGKKELWVALLEKAYAVHYGGKSYAGIKGGDAGHAMARILGGEMTVDNYYSFAGFSEAELLTKLKKAIEQKHPSTIGTKKGITNVMDTQGMIRMTDNHVYVPLAVDSIKREVTLYNPHGRIETYHVSVLAQACDFLSIAS
jgi:hypothetical protein